MGFLRDAKHRGKPKKKLSGKALDFSIESLLTKPTPNDYCWIDLKDGRYHHNGNFAAVSKTPLIVLELVTFTAGNANPFAFAYLKIS